MAPRIVPVILILLLAVVHGQMWFGRGNVKRVAALEQELEQQRADNARARLANEQLNSELHELRTGLAMVEEKARSELGMVQANEIFVQVTETRD
ncbi:MAG: septum formation initiator family protein [Ottowia sp.]|nr:septum formation initiator family protein [Ottowia sp.]